MRVFADTTCFDLAGVFTIANELRAMESMGAGRAMHELGWPAVALSIVGAVVVLRCLQTPPGLDRQRIVPIRADRDTTNQQVRPKPTCDPMNQSS